MISNDKRLDTQRLLPSSHCWLKHNPFNFRAPWCKVSPCFAIHEAVNMACTTCIYWPDLCLRSTETSLEDPYCVFDLGIWSSKPDIVFWCVNGCKISWCTNRNGQFVRFFRMLEISFTKFDLFGDSSCVHTSNLFEISPKHHFKGLNKCFNRIVP